MKKDYKVPKIILVQGFCPLKMEIALFPLGYSLEH